MNTEPKYTWPEVLETGEIDKSRGRGAACADGLCGWALCSAGAAPIPEKFGVGMAAIGEYLEITPTADRLMKYSDLWIAERDEAAKAVNVPA